MLPYPEAPKLAHPIPDSYWNLAGAVWAYTYAHLAKMGIEAVGGAELTDYPGQFASTSLLDWDTGQPNARYWVLKPLRENFNPGDKSERRLPSGETQYGQTALHRESIKIRGVRA